jgi:predicted outer membrane repeat protein
MKLKRSATHKTCVRHIQSAMSIRRMALPLAICSTVMLLTVRSAALGQTVWYVDDSSTNGLNNGSNWNDAFTELQSALAVALPGDEIRVGQGTYKPDFDISSNGHTGDRSATFLLCDDVLLSGGYAGYGSPDPNARDVNTNATVLTGDLSGNDLGTTGLEENSYHVVTADATISFESRLDGFTITAGNADGYDWFSYGGGLFNVQGSPTVANCNFINNSATNGGGVFTYQSSSSFTSCTFTENKAVDGGGLSSISGSPSLNQCHFVANVASRLSGDVKGGGLASFGSDLSVSNCQFIGNSATTGALAEGAGVYVQSGQSGFTGCTFTSNYLGGFGLRGGAGMFLRNATVSVSNCDFTDNQANSRRGGGLYCWGGDVSLGNSTFSQNGATDGGGVAYYSPFGDPISSVIADQCIFTGNTASGMGGAVWVFGASSSLHMNACTIQSNSATFSGGGVIASEVNNMVLTSCWVDSNTAQGAGGIAAGYKSRNVEVTRCVVTGNSATNGNGGGVTVGTFSDLLITNSAFNENTASQQGSAIASNGDLVIANSRFFSNSNAVVLSQWGGSAGTLTLANSTFAGNGQGHSVISVGTGNTAIIRNCIIWGGSALTGTGTFNAHFSNIKGTFPSTIFPGIGNINSEPHFVDLASGDLRLNRFSPCIDAGSNGAVPADTFDLNTNTNGNTNEPTPFDLDGNPRFTDDPCTVDTGVGTLPIVDMGAYEYVPDCNTNGVEDSIDIALGTSSDCNMNGCPDQCELVINDCNSNSVPDDCETNFDGDSLIDECDDDIDDDGVPNAPDACDYTPLGANIVTDPQSAFYGTLRGDLDGDCDCDLVDFAILQGDFTGPNP